MDTLKDKIKKRKSICIILGVLIIALIVGLVSISSPKTNTTDKKTTVVDVTNSPNNEVQNQQSDNSEEQVNSKDNSKNSQIDTDDKKIENITLNKGNNKKANNDDTNTSDETNQTQQNSKQDNSKKTSNAKTSSTKTEVSTSNTSNTSHTHKWTPVYKTVHHKEKGHYKNKVIKKAYDEPIYDYVDICNGCGKTELDFKTWDDFASHTGFDCGTGYHNEKIRTGTKHHTAVTKKLYVVDKKAYDEKVVNGYKCSCGATK